VTTDGLPYYTMAYCEGGSLANRLRQAGTLPVAEALRARLRRAVRRMGIDLELRL